MDKINKALIFGAGEFGKLIHRLIQSNNNSQFNIKGFIDDDLFKIGSKVNDLKVFSSSEIDDEFIMQNQIKSIIFAIRNNSFEKGILQKKISQLERKTKLPIIIPPDLNFWINNGLDITLLKNKINYEDFVERGVIDFDYNELSLNFNNKTVLITGGAGSIGSEICSQLVNFSNARVAIIDISEINIFKLKQNITLIDQVEIFLGDISDIKFIEKVILELKPDFVFNAAAFKHVDICEKNPTSTIRNNALSAFNLIDICLKNKIKNFVQISTDKAVDPTTVMGLSKRLVELYLISIKKEFDFNYIITRFGNVLGSSGSVLRIFEQQLSNNNPLTVTDREATRYFMSISEAARLVIKSSTFNLGTKLYVFNMGSQKNIYELACEFLKNRGIVPEIQYPIKIIGLKKSEKLTEKLFYKDENILQTIENKLNIIGLDKFKIKTITLKNALKAYLNGELELHQLFKLIDNYE